MNELTQTLSALIGQLKSMSIDPQGTDARALVYLEPLLRSIEGGDLESIQNHSLKLREFWLNQVPWCSDLSRHLEKVLIQLEEASQRP